VLNANSFYLQPYYPLPEYFPGIDRTSYILAGTMIRSTVDTSYTNGIYSLKRAFGYADNQARGHAPFTIPDNPYTSGVENAGGDAFDISWAIDSTGKYIELDHADFIRVHCAVMDDAGWLGQVSTEITGAVDVSPDPDISGSDQLLVIREIPPVMDTLVFPLEVFAFKNGRIIGEPEILWTSTMPDARIDANAVFHANRPGAVTITASLAGDDQVTASVNTVISLTGFPTYGNGTGTNISLYPNPAREQVRIRGIEEARITLFDLSGSMRYSGTLNGQFESIPLDQLNTGIYLVRIQTLTGSCIRKLVKE